MKLPVTQALISGARSLLDWLEARSGLQPEPLPVVERPLDSFLARGPGRTAPSTHHDLEAEPIKVRMAARIYRRLLRDYLEHLDGPDGDKETGWIPLGEPRNGELVVTGLVAKGPKADASWGDFTIDNEFLFAALLLQQSKAPAGVAGLVHTHPGGMDWNSTTDLGTDKDNVKTVAGGAAIYPIFTKEPIEADGHVVLGSSARVTFYGLRAARPRTYVRCEVVFDEGLEDRTSWLRAFEASLGECAGTAFALGAVERLPIALKPAEDAEGAIDLTCALGEERIHVRFSPEPGPITVIGPDRAVRVDRKGAEGRALARRILSIRRVSRRSKETV